MKKILFLFVSVLFLYAKIVDMVVASVNGEPITLYEVTSISKKMHIPYNKALNLLIDKKLFDSVIKSEGISVDEFDIENALEEIANSYGMSVYEFKRMLKEKGEWEEFEKELKKKILRDKFIEEVLENQMKITPEEVKEYYSSHKDEFKIFSKANVILYTSNNPKKLMLVAKNPLQKINGVVASRKILTPSELTTKELFILKNTPKKAFSPVIDKGIYYEMFYVIDKEGSEYLPFDKVKYIIYSKLLQQKRKEILDNYLARLRSEAVIKFYNP